jgi:hypothetical protein
MWALLMQIPCCLLPKVYPKVLIGDVEKRLKEILYQVANEFSCEVLELEVSQIMCIGCAK